MFNNSLKVLVFIFLMFLNNTLIAQNEAFHGGEGDGFGNNTSGVFNLSEIGFEGNNLSVIVNQAGGQADPTDQGPVFFTVVFSEAVTDFDETDIDISGTANPQSINVTGSGTTYTIELSNVSANGNIVVQIPLGSAHNSVGNPNLSSTSTDNSVTYTGLDLSVEINLANNQPAMSNASEVHFLVEFTESVSDFINSDVTLSGTANPSTVNVSGSGTTYDVVVSGMANDGTVIISIPANSAHNEVGSGNQVSINTQNTITCDFTRPTVEITLASGQTNPCPSPTLEFVATFSETISPLEVADIQLSGTAGATDINISHIGNAYTLSVSGMTQEGTVIVAINENGVLDLASNGNETSINTQNQISYSDILFTNEIIQALSQSDPSNSDAAVFDINFNREPADFDKTDIVISGNNSAGTVSLTGSGTDYQLSLTDFSNDGVVSVTIGENSIHDLFNNQNEASINTDNEITIDREDPNVEITLGNGQNTPSNNSLLIFSAVFSEDVTNFTSEDVQLSGSSGANSVNISGSGNEYFIEVSGMDNDGNVSVTIPVNVCTDLAGNNNAPSINTSNLINYDISRPIIEITQAINQEDPATTLPLTFYIEFSEDVVGFDVSKVAFGASSGVSLELSGSGTSYNVAVNGVNAHETITINMAEGVINDIAGNYNFASTNTDNSITYTGITGISDVEESENCLITCNENLLHIVFEKIPDNNSELAVYSLEGKLLFTKKQLNQYNSFSLSNKSSILVVKVINGGEYSTSLISTH